MQMTKEEAVESFGKTIDRIDNLLGALEIPGIPVNTHLGCLRTSLPEISSQLKDAYTIIVGENPWE
jgi:hypothetical protein